MSGRRFFQPRRRAGRWGVHGLLGLAATALAVVLTSSVAVVPAGAATSLVLLQMNLCNSGAAKACYSFGAAVTEAVAQIHRYRPQLVTFQETCRDDFYAAHGWGKLAQAMADIYGNDAIQVDFTPAHNRTTGEAYRGCINGEQYGIGVIYHGNGREIHQGWYANQGRGGEVRAWTCATVIKRRLTACTTHLTINRDVAMQQCRELMSILAAATWAMPEVIISGDVNLQSEPGQPHDVELCVPAGHERRDDAAVQQVFYTDNVSWVQGRYEPLKGTDHPLLYESFRV
jgi:hypothetical protein